MRTTIWFLVVVFAFVLGVSTDLVDTSPPDPAVHIRVAQTEPTRTSHSFAVCEGERADIIVSVFGKTTWVVTNETYTMITNGLVEDHGDFHAGESITVEVFNTTETYSNCSDGLRLLLPGS